MSIQARIPPALAAVHNFIRIHDPDEIHDFDDNTSRDLNPGYGDLAIGPANIAERNMASEKRDIIAQAMWDAYQTQLATQQYDYDM
jgi:hypothetical protein